METSQLYFDLPPNLIAQEPASERTDSRLLFLEKQTGRITHYFFKDLVKLIEPGAVLVFNNTRVRKARLDAKLKPDLRECELLFLEKRSAFCWQVIGKPLKRLKEGVEVLLPGDVTGVVKSHEASGLSLELNQDIGEDYFKRYGSIPLPPYIKRKPYSQDERRYQTVYAKTEGSVAAPTAGLHFTEALCAKLASKGVVLTELTLHVGLGTFRPIRTKTVEEHRMHRETYEINHLTAQLVNEAKMEGRAIIAVGTTSVRALESSALKNGMVQAGVAITDLFIKPGFIFKIVDKLITNFHTPCSSLLALVCAFAGYDRTMAAYKEAIKNGYRFFSYGDAMFIG